MVDLNALVENPSDLRFYWAVYITDGGEIDGIATLPNGDTRLVVLVPDGDCDDDCEQRIATSQNAAQYLAMRQTSDSPGGTANQLRNSLTQRYSFPDQRPAPRD
jgi:hypothetical protein